MRDANCLFCRIASGEIAASVIHEDEATIAFLDINPWQVGHALVIPRRHVADVLADDLVLAELGPTVARVGRLLEEKLGATACNVLSNAGADSGQEIFHAHVHVLPRYADRPGIANIRGKVDVPLEDVRARILA